MSLKLFVQGPGLGTVKVVEIQGSAKLAELVHLAQAVGVDAGGEPILLLEDMDEALDLHQTVESVGIGDRSTVHVAHCRRISASVRYGSKTHERDFSPAQRLRHVFAWAVGKHGFNIPDLDAQDLVLVLRGQQDTLDLDDHVGLLVHGDACAVDLDLVPRDRIQGGS